MNPDPEAELRERRELADSRLWTALTEHADAHHLDRDGDILSEFAIVGFWTNVDRELRGNYTLHYHTTDVSDHTALGLFKKAYRIEKRDQDRAEREE